MSLHARLGSIFWASAPSFGLECARYSDFRSEAVICQAAGDRQRAAFSAVSKVSRIWLSPKRKLPAKVELLISSGTRA
jgi:hypothetical protein